jgi:predicted DNA binding protein
MKFRKAVIGVRHKGCWGSLCTLKFPDVVMKEKGPIVVEETKKGVKLCACWEVSFKDKNEFENFINHLKTYKMIRKIALINVYDDHALIKTEWENKTSSYSVVLKNNSLYTSPVIQKNGYEVYEVITEDPKRLVKLMSNLDEIGEAKLFSVGRISSKDNIFGLTPKQLNAIQIALSHNFYDWPRKVSLDEISAMVGMKRRTFQENLRRAEARIIPQLLKSFLSKQEI